jgi:hypothetical protein
MPFMMRLEGRIWAYVMEKKTSRVICGLIDAPVLISTKRQGGI